jgi:Zn finger protein HypA/HybF involved in hydrogenase expression
MNATALIHGIGSTGLFPSRIFLPAFLTALLLRFGSHIPGLEHLGVLSHIHGQPVWFTSNLSLIVLGILSVVEILAQKNPEARTLLREFDAYLKAALAALTSLGVTSATDSQFISQAAQQASLWNGVIPLLSAAVTFKLSLVRRDVLGPLHDHLEGTHLDHLVSWAEDLWVAFGALLLVLFPILMVVLIGLSIGLTFLARKRLEGIEEHTRTPCTRCGTPIYPCAVSCPSCRQQVQQPCGIGFLGQSKPLVPADAEVHPLHLFEKRRCPNCATRLKARMPHQRCPACGRSAPAEAAFTQAYLEYLDKRLPLTLAVSLLLSLIPIIGLIVGAVYYRMVLVMPFAQYLPLGRRFLLRWGIRVLFLILVFFQWVPLLGGFVVPLMALISFTAYRSTYRSIALAEEQAAASGLATGNAV